MRGHAAQGGAQIRELPAGLSETEGSEEQRRSLMRPRVGGLPRERFRDRPVLVLDDLGTAVQEMTQEGFVVSCRRCRRRPRRNGVDALALQQTRGQRLVVLWGPHRVLEAQAFARRRALRRRDPQGRETRRVDVRRDPGGRGIVTATRRKAARPQRSSTIRETSQSSSLS